MLLDEEKKKKLLNRIFLVLAFFLPFYTIVIMRHFMVMSGGELGYDAFYHTGIAKLGPSVIMAKEFPWLDSSIWKSAFADKELLYHLSLWVILKVQTVFGFAAEPPFHFAVACYVAFLCGSFVFAGVRFRIPPALLCAGSLLLSLITPTWSYRMTMLRPHIVSIGYFLLMFGVLAQGKLKSKMILTAVISFLYAWSYSNPHFIVIPVLMYAFFSIGKDSKKALLLPVISFAAVILGLIIHPQFPNSFAIWKLQSWDALLSPMLADHTISKPTEMMPPPFIWSVYAAPLYVLIYVNLLYLIRLTERIGWKKMEPSIYALALTSAMFIVGFFLARRAVEYAAPLTVLLFLALVARANEEKILNPFRRFGIKIQLIILFVASLGIGSYTVMRCIVDGRQTVSKPPLGAVSWMDQHLKENEAIINLDWSDFPMLFYASHRQRYQWGMDPVFSLAAQPERTIMMNTTRTPARRPPTPREMQVKFGCRYAIILFPRVQHANLLYKNGWRHITEIRSLDGKHTEGWVFALDEQGKRPSAKTWGPQALPQKKE